MFQFVEKYLSARYSYLELLCSCGFEQKLFPNYPRYYQFENQEVMPVLVCLAWCQGCQHFVESEDLTTAQTILDVLQTVQTQLIPVCGLIEGDPPAPTDRCVFYHAKLKLLLARQSRPKCLRCSSTAIIPFSVSTNEQPLHPGCGQFCQITRKVLPFGDPFFYVLYTAEGNHIPRMIVSSSGISMI